MIYLKWFLFVCGVAQTWRKFFFCLFPSHSRSKWNLFVLWRWKNAMPFLVFLVLGSSRFSHSFSPAKHTTETVREKNESDKSVECNEMLNAPRIYNAIISMSWTFRRRMTLFRSLSRSFHSTAFGRLKWIRSRRKNKNKCNGRRWGHFVHLSTPQCASVS